MKYKTQETEDVKNPILDDIVDLIVVNKEFLHMLKCYNKEEYQYATEGYIVNLKKNCENLFKLAISLDPKHIGPTLNVELKPFESVKDLKEYEEKYYNMLKEIAKNAFEDKDVEVLAYLYPIIAQFEHYFCKIDEDNVSRETSSQ